MSRIDAKFAALRQEGRAGLVVFAMAGDPDQAAATRIFTGLPQAGADLIEIGMPFSDPVGDGPSIQAAGVRALKAGTTLDKTLAICRATRAAHPDTPIVLMGYVNTVENRGHERFSRDAVAAGADGVILVDMPPEEDGDFRPVAAKAGLSLVRLATPTTDDKRLPVVLENAQGFIYYVAVSGTTGTKAAVAEQVSAAVTRIRKSTKLPIAVGFGVRTPPQAAEIARAADAVVVGTALVEVIAAAAKDGKDPAAAAHALVRDLATAVRAARTKAA